MTITEYEARKQALLAEIERVFDGVEYDEGVAECINNLNPYSYGAKIKAELLNMATRWQEIPDSWYQHSKVSLLIYSDAHGFRYYLPAYLSWFLRFMDQEGNSFPFDARPFREVLVVLSVGHTRANWSLEKFSKLNSEQAKAVAHFLALQCERCIFLYTEEELNGHELLGYRESGGYKNTYALYQRALLEYWGQFLEGGFVEIAFPFSGPSRKWRETIASLKVIEPRRLEAYEARKKSLLAEIERVFDGVEREDGMTIHEAHALDNYDDPEDCTKARLLDTEARWQDVPDEAIQGTEWGLSILDAKGFHYYFPAYLVWCLRFADSEDEDADFRTIEAVDFLLDIRSYEGKDYSLEHQFSAFSDEQKRVIAHFVQFRHEQLDYRDERWNFAPNSETEKEPWEENPHADIQKALDNYWGQFLEG